MPWLPYASPPVTGRTCSLERKPTRCAPNELMSRSTDSCPTFPMETAGCGERAGERRVVQTEPRCGDGLARLHPRHLGGNELFVAYEDEESALHRVGASVTH
jgi:hypothetical protein